MPKRMPINSVTPTLDFQKKQDPSRDQTAALAEIEREITEQRALYGQKQEMLSKVVEGAAATV